MMKKLIKKWPAFLFFVLLTGFFELAVRTGAISSSLIPAPSMVFQTWQELGADFISATKESFTNTLAGLALAWVVGLTLAFLFSTVDFIKRSVLPFAVFFQTVPIIAIAPLLVIYFGFGAPTVIASSFIVALFPVIASVLLGLENMPQGQLDLFRLYGASPWQILWKLRLPRALPAFLAGFRISAGLALIGAVAGEFVAGSGLGSMIDAARTQQRVDIVFGALAILSALGMGFLILADLFKVFLNSRRPYLPAERNLK